MFEALLPRLWKIEHRDIYYHKKSRHAKFQLILSNLENRYEIVILGRLARSSAIDMSQRCDRSRSGLAKFEDE